nr:TMEM175 family protein [uncultured Roseateles sp.]
MHKGRFEAFSDGVIAIILTIMVLELKVPKEPTLAALSQLWPVWLAYALSYYNVFVLWADHHETFSHVTEIDRGVLYANGLFLFCSSLIPFATAFSGEEHWSSPLPVVLYGLVMLAVSLTFGRLRTKVSNQTQDHKISAQIRKDAKHSYGMAFFFLVGSAAALAHPRLGLILFVAIPITRRIARGFRTRPKNED